MKAIVIAALLAAAPLSHAGCSDFFELDEPAILSGAQSTLAEMTELRTEVVDYVETGESYVACSGAPDFYKNYIIEKLEKVAESFNAEITYFIDDGAIAG
jgi:ABC-type molybdate transport system substrate-binding protein